MATAEIYSSIYQENMICDVCDTTQGPIYTYRHGTQTEIRCEYCLPHCECGDLALNDGHDYCPQCNAMIEAEEKAAVILRGDAA